MKSVVGWTFAFAAALATACGLLYATLRRQAPAPVEEDVFPRRSGALSEIDQELILNKIREGDLQAAKGDLTAARKAWGEARRMGEGLWPIHEGLGDSYLRVKLAEEALAEYLTAEKLVPESLAPVRGGIVFKRAALQAFLGRPDDAFRGFLELDQPEALLARLVECFEKSGSKDSLYASTRERTARDPRLHALLAILADKLGKKADAARAWARYAILLAPWDRKLTGRAIELLRAEKLYDDAVEVTRAWAKAEPQAVDAYRVMGDLYREAGREKEAFVAYSSIIDVRAGDADAHRLFAQILVEMKRFDEAIAQFEESKKARPEEPQRWIDIAEAWKAKGDSAKSEALYEEIGKKNWDQRFGNITKQIQDRMARKYLDELEAARKAGQTDRVKELRRILGQYGVPEAGTFDIKVIMTWDTATDIDMDVAEPNGEVLNHGHAASKDGGKYYVDNTQGFGPETYTIAKAPAGVYKIGAHFHSGSGRTAVRFVVILYEDTPREKRSEQTLFFEKAGEQKWLSDVVIK